MNKHMSSYNLKAKNKKTGEIIEYYMCKDFYNGDILDKTNCIIYSQRGFNTLYEVIDDTPIEKGWREKFEDNRPPKDWTDNNQGYDEDAESYNKEFGYKHYCGQTHTIHEVTDWGNIKKFISQVEQQAYARGQEEAYRKSAEVALHHKYQVDDDAEVQSANRTCEKIAEAIEQLASKQ